MTGAGDPSIVLVLVRDAVVSVVTVHPIGLLWKNGAEYHLTRPLATAGGTSNCKLVIWCDQTERENIGRRMACVYTQLYRGRIWIWI